MSEKTDFDRDTEPINYPKRQDKRAFAIASIGFLAAACVLFGALLALINETTGGRGLLWWLQ